MKLRILLVIFLSACTLRKNLRKEHRYELYIDYPYVSFQGSNETQHLNFLIDSVSGMWYSGRLIINKKDTHEVHGFEKGYYLCWVRNGESKSPLLSLDTRMNARFTIVDSLVIRNGHPNDTFLKRNTTLYRSKR